MILEVQSVISPIIGSSSKFGLKNSYALRSLSTWASWKASVELVIARGKPSNPWPVKTRKRMYYVASTECAILSRLSTYLSVYPIGMP